MAHPFYVVVAWEYSKGPTDVQKKAADDAVEATFKDLPHALFLDRLALVGVKSTSRRDQLLGALNYLARNLHDESGLRFALSPPIATGSVWAGFTAGSRWDAVGRIARGEGVEDPAS
jgi:hypothetical protein